MAATVAMVAALEAPATGTAVAITRRIGPRRAARSVDHRYVARRYAAPWQLTRSIRLRS